MRALSEVAQCLLRSWSGLTQNYPEKEVSEMAWGILITVVMLFGMMGLAVFEATNVEESSTTPDVERDADKREVKKAA
jgi:hypothetical protein